MESIPAGKALRVLRRTGGLKDLHIEGRFSMLKITHRGESNVDFPIEITKCTFDELDSSAVVYEAPVEWRQCVFHRIRLDSGAYFTKGIRCTDSEFLSEILFDSGGHNSKETPIIFERVRFHGFVDFFDCWFRGPVVLRDVAFLAGTNLLNREKGWVQFDEPPALERVTGSVDLSLNLDDRDGVYVLDGTGSRERLHRLVKESSEMNRRRLSEHRNRK